MKNYFRLTMIFGSMLLMAMLLSPADARPESVETRVYRDSITAVVRVWVAREHGTGDATGVAIRADGLIATCEHVVRDARTIRVTIGGHVRPREFEATVVGRDRDHDVALLRIDYEPIETVDKDTDPVEVGTRVIVIGNPLSQNESLTRGVVSATCRSVPYPGTTCNGMVQIDAPINPGNSGGPVFDEDGKLVGLVSGMHSEARGIAFMTPIIHALRLVDELP